MPVAFAVRAFRLAAFWRWLLPAPDTQPMQKLWEKPTAVIVGVISRSPGLSSGQDGIERHATLHGIVEGLLLGPLWPRACRRQRRGPPAPTQHAAQPVPARAALLYPQHPLPTWVPRRGAGPAEAAVFSLQGDPVGVTWQRDTMALLRGRRFSRRRRRFYDHPIIVRMAATLLSPLDPEVAAAL